MTDSASSFVADTFKQSTSQVLGALTQTTKLTFDTVASFVESFSKVPPSLPALPMVPSKASIKEWLDVGFETAEQMLKLQHDLAAELVDRFAVRAAS